ncbi:MAG: ATP-NAD kinase family protein [Gammaproteobacteria bacterium]|nr:ATP-NAD kinase family protein [Gammaproteobacteria bacterium]
MNRSRKMQIGLVVNPFAGVGGPAALKGSDGADTVDRALSLGSESRVLERVASCLEALVDDRDKFDIITVAGDMGAAACERVGLDCTVIDETPAGRTSADDTRSAVHALQDHGVDLVLFAGGDGTARDVFDVIDTDQVVLGIPCGVKMHSGVFANNPAAASRILTDMINGRLVTVMQGEVRDIDEASFREGIVKTRFYGEMWVPEELRYLQQVKSAGKEIEELAVQEIAADIVENMEPGVTYFIGSGSTPAAIVEMLGLRNTLLGVDVVRDGEVVKADANESELYAFATENECRIVVTAIGGQGHIFGRGNQQFSARVIEAVGLSNIIVIATKTKLEALEGKPLLVDTGSADLDQRLAGPIRVVTGYEDAVLIPSTQ